MIILHDPSPNKFPVIINPDWIVSVTRMIPTVAVPNAQALIVNHRGEPTCVSESVEQIAKLLKAK